LDQQLRLPRHNRVFNRHRCRRNKLRLYLRNGNLQGASS
jgi:hypothetical protein